MIKAVLFDLDGTVADTAPDLGAALNHTRATRGLSPLPLASIRPQASHGSKGLLKLGLGIDTDHPDFIPLRDIFLDYYEHNICVHTTLFDGINELITELEQQNIIWGIVTNKPERFTAPLMKELQLDQRAAVIVSGDTCEHSKPHPAPMLHACKHIGIDSTECIYLGDDLRDIQAAHAANMRGYIAAYGYIDPHINLNDWQADGEINHPSLLKSFI